MDFQEIPDLQDPQAAQELLQRTRMLASRHTRVFCQAATNTHRLPFKDPLAHVVYLEPQDNEVHKD